MEGEDEIAEDAPAKVKAEREVEDLAKAEEEIPSAARQGIERKSKIGLYLLPAGGAALAGVGIALLAKGKDPLDIDDDGDGFTENEGDCNDNNRSVGPNGGFEFQVTGGFSGTIECSDSSVRQYIFTVSNNSCATLTLFSLEYSYNVSGSLCGAASGGSVLSIDVTSVASGQTAVVKRGKPGGHGFCCPRGYHCPGTCTITSHFTLSTSAGTRSVTNTYSVVGNGCPPC